VTEMKIRNVHQMQNRSVGSHVQRPTCEASKTTYNNHQDSTTETCNRDLASASDMVATRVKAKNGDCQSRMAAGCRCDRDQVELATHKPQAAPRADVRSLVLAGT